MKGRGNSEMLKIEGTHRQTKSSRWTNTFVFCEDPRTRHPHAVSSGCRRGLRILGLDLYHRSLDRRIRHSLWVLPAHGCFL